MRPLLLAVAVATYLLAGAPVHAIGADPPLADPAAEARAQEIARTLRCLVCQNQSIADSNAALARDLRRIVRERIAAGDDDAAVREFLVSRYGEWVLLEPPFNVRTYALWFGPFVLLALAAGGVLLVWRRRSAAAAGTPSAPLSPEEQRRLRQLLGEGGTG